MKTSRRNDYLLDVATCCQPHVLKHICCQCVDLQIDWGKWAITGNDPNFQGTGNPDTGEGRACMFVRRV